MNCSEEMHVATSCVTKVPAAAFTALIFTTLRRQTEARTSSVSEPPMILSPSPVFPFWISMVVSCPGTIAHVAGSS